MVRLLWIHLVGTSLRWEWHLPANRCRFPASKYACMPKYSTCMIEKDFSKASKLYDRKFWSSVSLSCWLCSPCRTVLFRCKICTQPLFLCCSLHLAWSWFWQDLFSVKHLIRFPAINCSTVQGLYGQSRNSSNWVRQEGSRVTWVSLRIYSLPNSPFKSCYIDSSKQERASIRMLFHSLIHIPIWKRPWPP